MSETPATPTGKRKRGRETVADMARSLGLVLLVVAAIVLLTQRQWGDATPEVDVDTALSSARRAAPYDVLAPQGLGEAWEPRSVRYRTPADGSTTWHLGYTTPTEEYAGLEQSDGDADAFVADRSLGGERRGRVEVAGETWTRYVAGDPERRTLARTEAGVTTVVAGSAPWPELERLAASLRAG